MADALNTNEITEKKMYLLGALAIITSWLVGTWQAILQQVEVSIQVLWLFFGVGISTFFLILSFWDRPHDFKIDNTRWASWRNDNLFWMAIIFLCTYFLIFQFVRPSYLLNLQTIGGFIGLIVFLTHSYLNKVAHRFTRIVLVISIGLLFLIPLITIALEIM